MNGRRNDKNRRGIERRIKLKHTKEPWEIQHDNFLNRPCNIRSTSTGQLLGWTVSSFMGPLPPEADANAERIVACVNACVGITNEALENGVIKEAMELFWRVSDKAVLNENNQMTYNGKTIFISDMEDV